MPRKPGKPPPHRPNRRPKDKTMRPKNLLILISAAVFASARADAPDGVFTVNFQSPSGNIVCGSSIKGTGWQCGSLENGILCTNSDGHGFLLNRKRQRMF